MRKQIEHACIDIYIHISIHVSKYIKFSNIHIYTYLYMCICIYVFITPVPRWRDQEASRVATQGSVLFRLRSVLGRSLADTSCTCALDEEANCQGFLGWVAVKEFKLIYHNPETISFTIYPYF